MSVTNAHVSNSQTSHHPSSASLRKNSIAKSTSRHFTISAVVMNRLSYHAYDRDASPPSAATEETVEISSLKTVNNEYRSELDSHANMVVLGRNCRLEVPHAPASYPGAPGSRFATVSSFSPEHEPLDIQVVDASVAFRCPRDETIHILHFEDALYLPTMKHNLIPPFLLREAGFTVNDVPRIHCRPLTRDSHCIVSRDRVLRVPLRLHGVFSYFPTFRPTDGEYHGAPPSDHHFMTPSTYPWNPNSDEWGRNEDRFIDEEGNLIPQRVPPNNISAIIPMAGFDIR